MVSFRGSRLDRTTANLYGNSKIVALLSSNLEVNFLTGLWLWKWTRWGNYVTPLQINSLGKK